MIQRILTQEHTNTTIGLLGPEGTFSEKAARQWSSSAELRYFDNIFDIVEAVLDGSIDCGILPIENSIEGSINLTLDLLNEYDLNIMGEVIVRIRLCLLAKGSIGDIKKILSHPQPLAQCRKYLKTNFKHAEIKATSSTANAAMLAAGSENIAAIASFESAQIYGLKILAENIQDSEENFTRFVVVGKGIAEATRNDKTSIIVYLKKNRPGALYEILGEFANASIDLTRIESRPTKKALGDYLFYIDFAGHMREPEINEILSRVSEKARKLKILGSYPRASKKRD